MRELDDDDPDDPPDRDDPDVSDMDEDEDGPEVMPCPYCGKMVHEQSEWCHHCGKYLSEEDRSTQVPRWIVVGTVLGLAGMLGWIVIWLVS